MKAKALVSLNHKGRTVAVGEIIELEDEGAAKELIRVKAVEEVKDSVNSTEADTKKLIENK